MSQGFLSNYVKDLADEEARRTRTPDYLSTGDLGERPSPIKPSMVETRTSISPRFTYSLNSDVKSIADQSVVLMSELSTYMQILEPGVYDEARAQDLPFYADGILDTTDHLLITEVDPVMGQGLNSFMLLSVPDSLRVSVSPNVNLTRVRDGFVYNYSGFDHFTMNFSGTTRGFYHPYMGYTNLFKATTRTYRNFMDFITMVKINGRRWTYSPKSYPSEKVTSKYYKSLDSLSIGQGKVKPKCSNYFLITYGPYSFLGFFNDITYSRKLYQFTYSFTFHALALYRSSIERIRSSSTVTTGSTRPTAPGDRIL